MRTSQLHVSCRVGEREMEQEEGSAGEEEAEVEAEAEAEAEAGGEVGVEVEAAELVFTAGHEARPAFDRVRQAEDLAISA